MQTLIQILMEQVRSLQLKHLQQSTAKSGAKPLWFSVDSAEGEVQRGDAELASAVGTNLKRLSEAQLELLVRHGGGLVEARPRKYAPELLT